jgi:hypothetical protein
MHHLDKETREHYEHELEKHYGEPIWPISDFCDRLGLYIQALKEGREDKRAFYTSSPYSKEITDFLIDNGPTIITFARKSNLLFRLLYLRQPLRTKKCPKHQGHWSGCKFGLDGCECQVGFDVTGWLE